MCSKDAHTTVGPVITSCRIFFSLAIGIIAAQTLKTCQKLKSIPNDVRFVTRSRQQNEM